MDDFLTFYFFFRIWNSQFWRIRSGIRIWSLRNRIWLPKCLIFLFTIMKFKNSQTIRQNAAWSLPTFVFIQKTKILLEKVPSLQKPTFFCQFFVLFIYFSYSFFLYNVIIYYLHHRCWFTTVKKSMSYMVSTTKRFHSFLTFTR